MSFYGLNRAAINAGVASFVAGAALLAASSTVEASGTRLVFPKASVTSSSAVAVTGVRSCFGGVGFVSTASGSAFPALLHLQFAKSHAIGSLKATHTDAWAHQSALLKATGFITRPGNAVSYALLAVSANPLLKAGFASFLVSSSFATADASVKRNGQNTVDVDGYAKQSIYSSFYANGLKTALGYATAVSSSDCSATALKTHGGAVTFTSVFKVSTVASVDMAISKVHSTFTADSLLTKAGQTDFQILFSLLAEPKRTTFGASNGLAGASEMLASPRLALLAKAQIAVKSSAESSGFVIKLGKATGFSNFAANATPHSIYYSNAEIVSYSNMLAEGYANIEIPDPDSRTMRRIGVDRVMLRPFVDRLMRRQA